MPRRARLDIPGLLQHVIVRGIERRNIFRDNTDRRLFLERFSRLLTDTGSKCYAWALIPNHVHLLIIPGETTLANLMRRLLSGYAVTFNQRHNRTGHLFQNRYKSIVCEEESYLLELIRYIHLNPLRAGLVKTIDELDSYPWCGHSVLMGNLQMPGHAEEVLNRFGHDPVGACTGYKEFVADGVFQGRREDLVGGGLKRSQGVFTKVSMCSSFDERILGSGDFVDSLLIKDALRDKLVDSLSLADLIDSVGSILSLSPEDLRRPSKKRLIALARGIVCYLAVRELRYKGHEVGKELFLTASGVSIALRRGEEFLKKNKMIKKKLQQQLEK